MDLIQYRMAQKLFLLVIAVSPLTTGQQAYLSLGLTNITINNTEILITDIGQDAYHGLPSLTCHTDLTTCCRNSDNNFMGSLGGEWYYPDGRVVPNSAAYKSFYRVRNDPQVARLARRANNPLSPTGSYCCVIPTTGGEMTFCVNIVVCLSLSLTNGMVSYSDLTQGVGSVATHSCDTGYTLDGESTRTCQLNWTWSGSALACKVTCPTLQTIRNGRIVYNYLRRPIIEGTLATYSCDNGYQMMGVNVSLCQANRIWSSSPPKCIAICPPLQNPRNGMITFNSSSSVYLEGTVATYSCDDGYQLIGVNVSLCQQDRLWSSSPPKCVAICPSLQHPRNGVITFNSSSSVYLEGTVATYNCNKGNFLIGAETRVCQADRSWSHDPYCIDQAVVQLQFGPTSYCLDWNQQKAVTVNTYMHEVIHEVILSGSETIPLVNIDEGVFTCRTSQTQTTFRTTINGTREASAVQAAADLQKWVESGPVVKVEWYLVDVSQSCPVSIDSLTEDECIEDQCVEGCVAVCKARG